MPDLKRKLGRPPGSNIPPEKKRKPRSMRLDDARWLKLQALGGAWLDKAIDDAKYPGPSA